MGFSVEQEYVTAGGIPWPSGGPLETVQDQFPAEQHSFYAALVYTQGNKLRTRLYEAAKAKGYTPASYVSPHAFVWRDVEIGEHAFIFENNVLSNT